MLISSYLVWESPGCGTTDDHDKDKSGFSEHELLDIMYNTCNTSNTGAQTYLDFTKDWIDHTGLLISVSASLLFPGEVLASTIVHYLQSMTSQSPEQDRLAALRRLLDPDCEDPPVSREAFHSTMTEWIAQCSQDRWDDNIQEGDRLLSLRMSYRVVVKHCDQDLLKIKPSPSSHHLNTK